MDTPQECSFFLQVPRVNEPLWEAIKNYRYSYVMIQYTQKNLLKSVIPIMHVVQKLFRELNYGTIDTKVLVAC